MLIKQAAIAAFFVVVVLVIIGLIVLIIGLIKTINEQAESFAKLKESHNRALSELNVHEKKAIEQMEYEA